ncbi:capsid protein [Beihai noda-like virus 11]|uniref:capsid protein n=1 Tax=Beihai noda-like virus 11 TaxID=1922464 RepID=UPI00090BF26B|nr:capsid protein [Beihai noda-like virus 11]APG76127.1 capsid protein [Beihai noda-like virus 11]
MAKKPTKKNARNRGSNRPRGAPVAQATNIHVGSRDPPIVVRGTGRFAHSTHAANSLSDGDVLFDSIINPSSFPRMSRIASAYQRYRFTRLAFTIQPMCPATTGAGYVAGFLKDPTDEDTSFDAIQGSQGAVIGKWWEHKRIEVRPPTDLLWTSLGENPRLFSPGKFVMTAVGTNTDAVNVSVLCEWEAVLSVPSLEDYSEKPVTEYFSTKDLLNSSYVHNSNSILQTNVFDGDVIPTGTILRIPFPIDVDYSLGAGDVASARYCYFLAGSHNLTWGLYSGGSFSGGSNYYSDGQPTQCVLPKGTRFEVIPN